MKNKTIARLWTAVKTAGKNAVNTAVKNAVNTEIKAAQIQRRHV